MSLVGWVSKALTAGRSAVPPSPVRSNAGWWPIVREPYTGAWQKNDEIVAGDVLSYYAVFACVTLIAADIGKVNLRLVERDEEGIWHEAESPAYSPVLRRPNRFQTIQKFLEYWISSKLIYGNAYVLKVRDQRNVVIGLYVLDPRRVVPLVAADGAVYYELKRDELSTLDAPDAIVAPQREIIHDPMITLYHPLIGVSPIYACGLAAMQGLAIQRTSYQFFGNGSTPGGILTAPGAISDETANRLRDYWNANYTGANIGKVAVLGDGLKYEAMTVNAVDAQLVDQLKLTAEQICSCFHVPPYMIGAAPMPPYGNVEPAVQQYYGQCLQSLYLAIELALDAGLEMPSAPAYGTEFDVDDLIWMDTSTKTKAAADSIGSGALSPDEARRKYFGLGKVAGGDSPYLQQQYFSLAALAERDAAAPFAKAAPPPEAAPPSETEPEEEGAAAFDLGAFERRLGELTHA